MKVNVQTDFSGNLTSDQMTALTSSLKNMIAGLQGWSLNQAGLLVLDLGDLNESQFQSSLNLISQLIGTALTDPVQLTLVTIVNVETVMVAG